jgi:hypothetical protein
LGEHTSLLSVNQEATDDILAYPPKYGDRPLRLPIVARNGKRYCRDDRLREYRHVFNPHDVIGRANQ